jgi:hypothetical protein
MLGSRAVETGWTSRVGARRQQRLLHRHGRGHRRCSATQEIKEVSTAAHWRTAHRHASAGCGCGDMTRAHAFGPRPALARVRACTDAEPVKVREYAREAPGL